MMSAPLELQIKMVPNVPRVYQYFDKYDVIIYFARAKNLKRGLILTVLKPIKMVKIEFL
jgi:excinuclease UvrABC nuclease subunit